MTSWTISLMDTVNINPLPKHFGMRLIKLVSSVMRDASYFKFWREYIALDYGIFLGNLILI